jgi:hypothetical protein
MKPDRDLLRKMFAAWNRLSPSLNFEGDEREARMDWTRATLGQMSKGGNPELRTPNPEPSSWNDLTKGQAVYLLKRMNEESGDGPAHRAIVIAKLAADLWPGHWDEFLRHRIQERFGFNYTRAEDLEPIDAHRLIEELLDRIARRDECDIEEVRKRVLPQRPQRTQRKAVAA